MKMWIAKLVLATTLLMSMTQSYAQEYLAIESYKCIEFLSDSAKPDEPQKLMRSVVMIAWATGFAAAHQRNKIRADAKAMQLIAIMAGDACRKNPDKLAVEAIVQAVRHFATLRRK